MIGRADIEGSKSNVAMNAWLPQASYPCGNFSDTSCLKLLKSKGSIGHPFRVCIRTGNQDQVSIWPFPLREVSVLSELTLGHLRYLLTDVPPQSNTPPGPVRQADCRRNRVPGRKARRSNRKVRIQLHGVRKEAMKVVVFQLRRSSHLCYTSQASSQGQISVKLNRVFFPH